MVPRSEIKGEDYNCNIRRYVDNAPPPEPQDALAYVQRHAPEVADPARIGYAISALLPFWGCCTVADVSRNAGR